MTATNPKISQGQQEAFFAVSCLLDSAALPLRGYVFNGLKPDNVFFPQLPEKKKKEKDERLSSLLQGRLEGLYEFLVSPVKY